MAKKKEIKVVMPSKAEAPIADGVDIPTPEVVVEPIVVPEASVEAPKETKKAKIEAELVVVEEAPEKPLTSAEAGSLHARGIRFTEPITVTQESYDRLLSAYNSLKQRTGLDPHIERQLDAQAGLI